MILDASAILAVLLREPGCEDAALVLSSRMRKNARAVLNEFLREVEVEIISFTRDHYEAAVDAFERYGEGRHAAALNFRDCMTYAVARISGMPLFHRQRFFENRHFAGSTLDCNGTVTDAPINVSLRTPPAAWQTD